MERQSQVSRIISTIRVVPLNPGTHYYWKVKTWNHQAEDSAWSSPNHFITALFTANDWNDAQWIGFEEIDDTDLLVPGVQLWGKNVRTLALRRPVVPLFRKEFPIDKPIQSATLFISGLGHYQSSLNGQSIGQDFLSPGWTDYRKRCLYNTYDVTEQIKPGQNVIGATVGPGFYNVNNERYRKLLVTYGMPKLMAMLKIVFADGSEEAIVTDQSWKTTPSPIPYSGIYGGENYNGLLEQEGWDQPDFDDQSWQAALLVRPPTGVLRPEITYPVQVRETFRPQTITPSDTPPNRWLYDFGQNASGIPRMTVKGQAGQTVRLTPGERGSTSKGTASQGATGRPHYYEYTLKGSDVETWQPRFSYYGFRFVQVDGAVPAEHVTDSNLPIIKDLTFLHTCNSAPRTGTFSCSNELFNRIHNLILYAIQSNTQSVSTDCPHREKLGWLEQAYLMGGSIHYNLDIYHLYRQTVLNMMDAQYDNGLIPNIAPEYVHFGGNFSDSPEWGSAGIVLPWQIYRWYGDISVMDQAWPMMEKYLQYLASRSEAHIVSHGLGDWYDVGPKPPGYAQLTPKSLTATALYYHDAHLMAKMAGILGKATRQQELDLLAIEIKDAFNGKFFDPNNATYSTASQTALAMPLAVGLVEQPYLKRVQDNLIATVQRDNKAVTAGDIGFHFLVKALTEAGAAQLLYEMNNRDDVPGYGYQLKRGATALTESWAALPNVSNNHLMLGHLMEWFYQGLGGIQQDKDSVAYQKIRIAPAYLNDLDHVETRYRCPYGLIKSAWRRSPPGVILNVSIPVNTTATLILPTSQIDKVTKNGMPLTDTNRTPKQGVDSLEVNVGSGTYQFEIEL